MAKYTKRELIASYAIDWTLAALFMVTFLVTNALLTPFNRRFSLEDKSIQYPFAEHERVPLWLCFALAVILPAAVISVIAVFFRRSLHDLHHGLLGLCLTITLTIMVTEAIKTAVGRPRPDFIDRCQPVAGSQDDPVFGLSNSTICTQTDKYIMNDGYKSMPSGHSSTSFAGLGYLSLYLAGKLHVFDRKGHTYKSLVITLPLIGAALIAISRTEDYRHHWQDITVGGIIGLVFAYFSYRQYYHTLESRQSHLPFKHRLHHSDLVRHNGNLRDIVVDSTTLLRESSENSD
ncbi:6473_t:CDS:2 [Paraglomus occultum]|uniref:6473_t:CDS:1 n=1 Tax=Paraglomus occultum TaxID=144539 RepID=A0A9N9CVG4_9GLOM|nr:6473_t:CDS:2 [Paraglomus occultum]